MDKRFINTSEFEKLYGFAQSTQAEYRRKKKIPYIKIGGMVRYDNLKIEEWFKSHAIETMEV